MDNIFSLFWGAQIEVLKFDIKHQTIYLKIKRNFNGDDEWFDVMFEKVVSFSWVNSVGEFRNQHSDWEYMDLTSFDSVIDSSIKYIGDKFISKYESYPNICIEIWDSILLIEAMIINVNDQKYSLN